MTTTDELLSVNKKQQTFVKTFGDNKSYLNFNLNHSHKCSTNDVLLSSVSSPSFSKLNKDKKIDSLGKNNGKNTLQSWNTSSKTGSSNHKPFNCSFDEAEAEKKWKKDNHSSKNNTSSSSTLSLHIAAYENSIEANTVTFGDNEGLKKKEKFLDLHTKFKNATFSASKIQNPFEFPRQQSEKMSKPEIMQFKASQKLFNPNESIDSSKNVDQDIQRSTPSNKLNDSRRKQNDDKAEETTEESEIKEEKKERSRRRRHSRESDDERKEREIKDKKEGTSRKRRRTRSPEGSEDSDGKDRAKRIRRSEPVKRIERRHFLSRRSVPPPLPKVDYAKLAAGEYPIHEVPAKWNLSFEPEDITELQPRKAAKPRIRMSSPQPIPITESSEAESSSSSPTKKVKSVVGNFWRVKPPFPRPRTIIAKDGTCLTLFFTEKYVFSNHFPADFTINGIEYCCSEQYYMRFKAVYFGDNEIAEQIMQTSDPKAMKRLGRQVEGFDEDEWKKVSLQVMKAGCYNKFSQNKVLRYELFRTIDTTLVEASPMDKYWGVGLGIDHEDIRNPKKWRGENLLGYILTKLRDYLKRQPEYQEEIKQVYTEFDPTVA